MFIEIDFNSDEAIYTQLCNQIIMGIARETLHEGDSLPSVRALANSIGVNMHTVNKAYTVLKDQGYLTVDRRRSAVVYIDKEKIDSLRQVREELRLVLARACCKNISREDVYKMIDEIYEEYK